VTGRASAAALVLTAAVAGPPDHEAALREGRPELLYSADPADPWNRIHHLLFTRRIKAGVLGAPTAPVRQVERLEGGDLPEFMIIPEAGYLLDAERYRELVLVLEAEAGAPKAASRTVEARVMFQQDLWNRFDAVQGFLSSEQPDETRSRARRLGRLLGRVMKGAACAPAELLAIRPEFAEAAAAFPQALDPRIFVAGSGWKELVSTTGDLAVEQDTTEHARRAGYRIVFRRFVKVPEGAGEGCLEQAVAVPLPAEATGGCFDLPEATRAVLLETPLAVARDGEIVPVPLVLGVQSRTVSSPGTFEVLHASRKALASPPLRDAGLVALSEDALIPQSASAFRRYSGQPLVPMKASCPLCHGPRGEALGTNRLHVRPRTQLLLPDNTVEQDRVARAKRADAAYAALREVFAGN